MACDNNYYLHVAVVILFYGTWICTWIYPTHGFFFEPELQICDGTHLRKFRTDFCLSKLVFASNSTKVNSDCICVSGIWLIINRNCVPSTVVSNEGCMLTPEVKAMQFLGALEKDDFFAVISQSETNFDYKLLRPVQNVIVHGQIWIYNGILTKSGGGYCAEKLRLYSNRSSTTKFKGITKFTVRGKLTVQYECPPYYTEPMTPNLNYALRNAETSECTIDCSKESASKLIIKRERAPTDFRSARHMTNRRRRKEDHGYKSVRARGISKITQGEAIFPVLAPGEKLLIQYLHRSFLIKIMDYGFSKNELGFDSQPEYRPPFSFMVLEKLKDIAYKTCAGRVASIFLEYALVIFRVAYETRGTDLVEMLQEQEAADIMQFLNECHDSIVPFQFNKGNILFCPDELIETVEKDGVAIKVNLTTNGTKNFYLEEYHLSVEAPWNMIDLTMGVCIGAFAESYILYHKMEQALEKLFIKDLTTLWKHPPKHAKLYNRIYGPNWWYNGENLERCVQSVYTNNTKLHRLQRPFKKFYVNMTGVSETEIGRMLSGYHKPIAIPEITIGKRKADASVLNEISILNSANFTCQPFNELQCRYS